MLKAETLSKMFQVTQLGCGMCGCLCVCVSQVSIPAQQTTPNLVH